MKRAKILTTILALALGTTAMVFGVMSATTLNFSVGASLSFDMQGLQATVTAKMVGAKADENNTNLAPSDALGTVDADGTVNKTIYTYNANNAPQSPLSTWVVGNIHFNNSVATPIVFSVTVTNYTKGKKLEVKITEVDGSTELTSANSKLSSIATSNSVSAIASEATESAGAITPSAPVTATITYTLKNLNQAPASTLPITLKVEIGEDPPKIITPAAPTGVSPNTNIPGATIQANNYDIYNLPCEATGTDTTKYLLSWYSDSQHTNQVPYNNYTPSTPQTLYAKTSKYPLLPNSAITMSGNAITNINTTTADFAIPAKVGAVKVTTLQGCCYGNTSIKNVELPYGVANILANIQENGAFDGCTSLTSITIPSSVTSIGSWAFSGCTSLTSITIPSSVTSIGRYAFYGCTSLTSITIPSKVTSIGDSAFKGCTSLTSINIPSSVTSIGNSAFKYCTKLAIVKILRADLPIISLGSSAFSNCHATLQIQVPNGVLNDYKTGSEWSTYSAKIFRY